MKVAIFNRVGKQRDDYIYTALKKTSRYMENNKFCFIYIYVEFFFSNYIKIIKSFRKRQFMK